MLSFDIRVVRLLMNEWQTNMNYGGKIIAFRWGEPAGGHNIQCCDTYFALAWAGGTKVMVGGEKVMVPLELVSGFICEERRQRRFLSAADTRLSPASYYSRP